MRACSRTRPAERSPPDQQPIRPASTDETETMMGSPMCRWLGLVSAAALAAAAVGCSHSSAPTATTPTAATPTATGPTPTAAGPAVVEPGGPTRATTGATTPAGGGT